MYLPWMGAGVHTLNRGYLPLMGRGYLPWIGEGVPTLDRGREYLTLMGGEGTYFGQGEGLPTFDGGGVPERGYLPWMGGTTGYAAGGTSLAASRRRTFLFRIPFTVFIYISLACYYNMHEINDHHKK